MATAYPDWADGDEMVGDEVMDGAGCVCSSWYAAYAHVRRVRIPITDTAPCLLYSASSDDDAGAATLDSVTSGATFKVRLPDPPLRSRALVGSAHGWLATADEASSNLHLVSPLSGAQVALPPVTTLHRVESFVDGGGNLVYSVQESEDPDDPDKPPVQYPAQKLRLFLYSKVVMSCSPSIGRLHRPSSAPAGWRALLFHS